ncbi:MAG: lipocalin-like domain-containing protein [Acidovorax sp.]|nr:lipocalin-like domain-containing protein [Acidovorax sp.]
MIILQLAGPGVAGGGEFQPARPGRVFQFPRDHGAHPEFKTEWWYYVGHLKSDQGESFGYQLTFFRAAVKKLDPQARSAWALHTIYFAHLAITDVNGRTFWFREKAGRGALGLSGAEVGKGKVWIDSWQAELKGKDFLLEAQDEGLALKLVLTPRKPPALHGEGGFSRKAAGQDAASHYYSISRLSTVGDLTLGERNFKVSGTSWMDHEFFTGSLAPGQVGWDWFALQLGDGAEIMLYLLRHQDGRLDAASSGTLIDPQGKARHLNLSDFMIKPTGAWKSPHSGTTYPAAWEITIPGPGYHLTLTPTLPDQEIRAQNPARITYWEGQVNIQGYKNRQPITGQGYTELTGYAGGLEGWF